MTTQLARALAQELGDWTADQIEVIREQVAAGTSDAEFAFFMNVAKARGLDPFCRQIHAVMRWDGKKQREVMAIQTGIDGYRLIADRTGCYVGNDDAEFVTEPGNPYPIAARVTVWKLAGGQRCAFTATARWSEYVGTKKGGAPTRMWASKPYLMLAKCAEALALRKAFPGDLSGLYTNEEMAQAGAPIEVEARVVPQVSDPRPVAEDVDELVELRKEIQALREKAQAYVQTLGPPGDELAERAWGEVQACLRHNNPSEIARNLAIWNEEAPERYREEKLERDAIQAEAAQ